MNPLNNQAVEALSRARSALQQGNKPSARYWARRAASLEPDREEPWLILAALGSPRASIKYLQEALEINPSSKRARKGMHWAVNRYRKSNEQRSVSRPLIQNNITPATLTRNKTTGLPWVIFLCFLLCLFLSWTARPVFSSIASSQNRALSFSGVAIIKSSRTPTPTFTPTPSPTPTETPTSTPTLTLTSSETPYPTETETPPQDESKTNGFSLPENVVKGERWIDVDLTNQRVYAYQGKNLANSFVVSTGTWQHPTVTGQYNIYVKYTYADMAGPGYYLPNVPYVMYFYKGYGIHGTYWHDNFGTPMSHGCINLRTEDAAWIFNWSSIGTLVNIHY